MPQFLINKLPHVATVEMAQNNGYDNPKFYVTKLSHTTNTVPEDTKRFVVDMATISICSAATLSAKMSNNRLN